MDAIYKAIEDKIIAAGYTGMVDGRQVYNEICDEIEDKEPGSYIFMSKVEEDFFFEYKIDVMEDNFNLSYVNIQMPGKTLHVDFDAE